MPPASAPSTRYLSPEEEALLQQQAAPPPAETLPSGQIAAGYGSTPVPESMGFTQAPTGDPAALYAQQQQAPAPQVAPMPDTYLPPSQYPASSPAPSGVGATQFYGGESAFTPLGNSREVLTSHPASGAPPSTRLIPGNGGYATEPLGGNDTFYSPGIGGFRAGISPGGSPFAVPQDPRGSAAPMQPQPGQPGMPANRNSFGKPQGLLAQYFDEAASHARAMKVPPPKPKKITQEERKRMERLAGNAPVSAPLPPRQAFDIMTLPPTALGASLGMGVSSSDPAVTFAQNQALTAPRPIANTFNPRAVSPAREPYVPFNEPFRDPANIDTSGLIPGTPTLDFLKGQGYESPEVSASIDAIARQRSQNLPIAPATPPLQQRIGQWFAGRTSDQGRAENREAVQTFFDNLPEGTGLGPTAAEAGVISFRPGPDPAAPSSAFLPAPWKGMSRGIGLTRTGGASPPATTPATPPAAARELASANFLPTQLLDVGFIDGNGRWTPAGIEAGVNDPLGATLTPDGRWTENAAALGIVPPEAVGRPEPYWASPMQGQPAPSDLGTDAGQALVDPNAPLPVTAAEVIAVESGNAGGGGGGRSSGRSRSSGGGSSGGGGFISRRSGRSSRGGGFSFGDEGEDFGSWEDFLRDFDNDGDMDEKDERRAKMEFAKRGKTRRGKRGGKRSGGVPPMGTSPIRAQVLGNLSEAFGRPIQGWPERGV